MRYTLAVVGVAAGLGVGGGLLIGWRTADQPRPTVIEQDPPAQPATPQKDTPSVAKTQKPGTKIPFHTIYTTSRQHDLRTLDVRLHEDSQQELNALTKHLEEYRVLTTFIVSAPTSREALSKTLAVFTKGKETWGASRKRTEFIDGDRVEFEDTLWVFLYLGTALDQGRPEWVVSEVSQTDTELIIAYRHTPSGALMTDDPVTIPYCYWIPLDKQTTPGRFTIRLIDWGAMPIHSWDKLTAEQKQLHGTGKESLVVRVYVG
jgi:hypothetical protein